MARQREKDLRCTSLAWISRTTLHVARPKHIAKQGGWRKTPKGGLQPAPLLEMGSLEGHATSDDGESKFQLTRCVRQGVEAPTLWLRSRGKLQKDEEDDGNPY